MKIELPEGPNGKPEVFLILAIRETGNLDVCAITSTQKRANAYRHTIQRLIDAGKYHGKNIVRVWIERREIDHLYAASMLDPDYLEILLPKDELELVYDSLGRGNEIAWRRHPNFGNDKWEQLVFPPQFL